MAKWLESMPEGVRIAYGLSIDVAGVHKGRVLVELLPRSYTRTTSQQHRLHCYFVWVIPNPKRYKVLADQ